VLVRPTARLSPLTLWHLLSLDAPTVATVWTAFIAHCIRLALPWTELAAMFVAVWMIYAADRLLDARDLDAHERRSDLEERHRFHHRHRKRFFAVMVAAAGALVLLLAHLHPAALLLYAMLASLLSVWLLAIHLWPATDSRRLPKELAVGIFFPAAVFIPTVARVPSLQPKLLPCALLFALVCTLNCLYLYAWEHSSGRSRARAHWTTLLCLRHLAPLTATTILASLALAIVSLWQLRFALAPALACAASAALLLWLNHTRSRLPKLRLRALADLVLLTPLLLWLVRW
jgi:hypothetical protein